MTNMRFLVTVAIGLLLVAGAVAGDATVSFAKAPVAKRDGNRILIEFTVDRETNVTAKLPYKPKFRKVQRQSPLLYVQRQDHAILGLNPKLDSPCLVRSMCENEARIGKLRLHASTPYTNAGTTSEPRRRLLGTRLAGLVSPICSEYTICATTQL